MQTDSKKHSRKRSSPTAEGEHSAAECSTWQPRKTGLTHSTSATAQDCLDEAAGFDMLREPAFSAVEVEETRSEEPNQELDDCNMSDCLQPQDTEHEDIISHEAATISAGSPQEEPPEYSTSLPACMIKVEQLQALSKAKDETCNAALVKCEHMATELQKFCKEDLALTSTSCAQHCDTALQEALERLQKLLEVITNHYIQVQAEKHGMQLQGTQHIQLLQGQLCECENAKTMLHNRLKSMQAQPVSRARVPNYYDDTESLEVGRSAKSIRELFMKEVKKHADALSCLLQNDTDLQAVLSEAVPPDRWKSINRNSIRSSAYQRDIKTEVLTLLNTYCHQEIWSGDRAIDEVVPPFAFKKQMNQKITDVLNEPPVDQHSLNTVNRYLSWIVEECKYWEEKCKHNATCFNTSVREWCNEVALKLTNKGLMQLDEKVQDLIQKMVFGAIYIRIVTEASHPMYALFVPADECICTCPGIRVIRVSESFSSSEMPVLAPKTE